MLLKKYSRIHRKMQIFKSEFIIDRPLEVKEKEILAITFLAAGFCILNDISSTIYEVGNYRQFTYIGFSPNIGMVGVKVGEFEKIRRISYEKVIGALRQMIKNNEYANKT